MKLQAHIPGQISGQVPNQAGSQLPGHAQLNGNSLPSQMPSLGGVSRSAINMDPELRRARAFIQEKICEMLLQRHPQPTTEMQKMKIKDLSKRLEEGMLKAAITKEDYMNLNTLESRLSNFLRRASMGNHNQPYPQLVSSSPIGTMIPTPGMSHGPNSNMVVASSIDASMISSSGCNNSIVSTSFNSVNMLPAGGMLGSSLNRSDGLSNGYQQSSTSFSVGSGGNMPSMGVPRISSQMIPTPGFTVNSNHSHMNIDSSTNGSVFSSADSTMVPQSQLEQQKQHIGDQSHVLPNLGSQMSSGMRSGSSDGYASNYANSPKHIHQHFDQNQKPVVQGDGYGLNNVDPFASGNFYASATSSGSMMNTQNTNSVKLPSIPKTSSLISGHSNLHGMQQAAHIKSQAINQLEKLNFQSSSTSRDALLHSQQQYPQRPQQFQQPEQYSQSQQQFQLKLHSQQPQHLVNDDAFNQSQLSSNLENQVKSEPGIEHHKDLLNSHAPEQFHMSEMQNQFQQNSSEDCSRSAQYISFPSGQHDLSSSAPQNSQQMLHPHQLVAESQNKFSCLTVGAQSNSKSVVLNQWPDSQDASSSRLISKPTLVVETSEDLHPSLKRIKIEHCTQSVNLENDNSASSVSANCESLVSRDAQSQTYPNAEKSISIKSELTEVKAEVLAHAKLSDMKMDSNNTDDKILDGKSAKNDDPGNSARPENIKTEKEIGQDKQENAMQQSENAAGTKSGKPKIKGVSLTELFTPEQVREHITGLRQWVGQSKSKAEKNQAMEHAMSENSCQLCAVEKLTFEPPPIYCTTCGVRIKRNNMYYTMGTGDTRHYFCIPCYNDARTEHIVVDGTPIAKSRLEKKKNDEETEEWWVQCDKCEAWQHQICALFNGRRNDGGQAEYTCPNCYIEEVERGERMPLPQSAVLGAKDLPRTILSDHIEQRLFKRLKHERQERARFHGKTYDEVPGADSLVVRVVSSVDKKLEVKQRFLEIFQEENYPTEFPYKSKVVLLFQKIEGVEVCLFGMPEIKSVTGEALRTFVYHEILIGYLEYCKLRGFTSCYIWACPPLKGEDYILYCHPEIQKTPKSDKLREWYLAMLRKAAKENVVVDITNLYDHFFTSTGECRAKVTAARLPYFDGDYWPGAAEDLIYQLRQEEDGRKQNKKGTTKKTITKRALKASGQSDLSGNASKDLLLMHKLGETISPMKEDFIMVHLQHACAHCCILMVCGNRWVCNQCKNFQICDKCYEAELKREERERHPVNQREKHNFFPVEITDVPSDTKDKDDILESEFFDTRQAFLSLCQGNHYQYDTLRRAKHSSMMVLYHLHNPTAPAFVITCNICYLDIETGQGWHCEVCPEYDICNSCYQKGGVDHPHKLTNHPSMADRDAQNKEARQLRVLQLRKMLDLLVHASQCRSAHCQYPNCRKVKGLFRHGMHCKTRASGGCVLCKKMWYLLQLHARACKESECHVPRCRDLKEHLRRLQQQSDSRRRAAVMEMMRQRAAEVANNAG
ncbi:hypothetical protein TSUD_297740 [Trifolium subterraneum]|nr:hypothetical protein TSUD_297740 [Trifolium subterraneum]